jgi:hypothetical protein
MKTGWEADRGQPRYVCGPFAHLSSAPSRYGPDVDGRYRTRHGVETGGEDDRVEGERLVGGIDARSR